MVARLVAGAVVGAVAGAVVGVVVAGVAAAEVAGPVLGWFQHRAFSYQTDKQPKDLTFANCHFWGTDTSFLNQTLIVQPHWMQRPKPRWSGSLISCSGHLVPLKAPASCHLAAASFPASQFVRPSCAL